jgi:NAD(P)-dependent dehydrogenase (short-subunit alcohol dehydrogenase family)
MENTMVDMDRINAYADEMKRNTKAVDILVLKANYDALKAHMNATKSTDDDEWDKLLAYQRILTPFGFIQYGNVWD